MKLEILKDKYINCWVVWEVHCNYSVDLFHAKTRKECKEWIGRKYKNK